MIISLSCILLAIIIFFVAKRMKLKTTEKTLEKYTTSPSFSKILTVDDNFQMSTVEFPRGMIMSYYPPDPKHIEAPQGWSICDGSNGTTRFTGSFCSWS